MRVLSLFDGISCGMVALERAGIAVEKYDAYEIDKDAIEVSKFNYPMINHCGDVFNAVYNEGEYDLLIGGSPCTNFSIAKGSYGRETKPNSGIGWELFSQYVRALNEAKPKYFLYENNASMSKEIKAEITKYLGVEPILINSVDFSAQERKRLYWTNIKVKEWTPKHIVFSDIADEDGYRTRSIVEYKDTYKWNKDHTHLAWDTSGKGYYSQQSRARTMDCVSATVVAGRADDKGHVYLGNDTIRIKTISELEKLQTLPVGYTSCLKRKESRGICIGNGWTVDVIAHILSSLKEK